MMNDLLIIQIWQWELVHFHDVESRVWEDQLVTSTINLVDVLGDFNHLNAFHVIQLPYPNLTRIISWQNEVGILNIRYTCNNRRVSFQFFLQVDGVSLILQLKYLQLVVVTCSDNQLTGNVVMKCMTSWTAHFVSNNRFSVFVDYKWFFVIWSCITHTNASQMVYLAYVIHHYCFFTVNFVTHWFLLNVPKVYGVLISSYPLLKKIQVEYFFPIVFRYCFLSIEVVRCLPKSNPNSVDNCSNSLMELVKIHWQYSNLSGHVFVSFRNDLWL